MESIKVTMNFFQILDNAINNSLEKAAEKKGISVPELIEEFRNPEYLKTNINNQIKLEKIHKPLEIVSIANHYEINKDHRKQECLVIQ
jgi:hypothetical protein